IDGDPLALTTRVVALGEGPSAVDVVEFRALSPATLGAMTVGFVAGLGNVALEVRAPSGQRVFRRLLTDGEKTPSIGLSPKPREQQQDASAESREPSPPPELRPTRAGDVEVQSSASSESSAQEWAWLAT